MIELMELSDPRLLASDRLGGCDDPRLDWREQGRKSQYRWQQLHLDPLLPQLPERTMPRRLRHVVASLKLHKPRWIESG